MKIRTKRAALADLQRKIRSLHRAIKRAQKLGAKHEELVLTLFAAR
jgi:hypothetical protein